MTLLLHSIPANAVMPRGDLRDGVTIHYTRTPDGGCARSSPFNSFNSGSTQSAPGCCGALANIPAEPSPRFRARAGVGGALLASDQEDLVAAAFAKNRRRQVSPGFEL